MQSQFFHKGNLKTCHASIHEGKKSFECEFCNYTFSQKGNFKTHIAVVHEGKKSFRCDFCNSNFSEGAKLFKFAF